MIKCKCITTEVLIKDKIYYYKIDTSESTYIYQVCVLHNNEYHKVGAFSKPYFDTYFTTIKDIRKKKLERLKSPAT